MIDWLREWYNREHGLLATRRSIAAYLCVSNCIREAVNYQHTYRLYGLLRAMSCLLSRVSSVSDAFAGGEGEPTVEEELLEPVSSTCCSASSPSASAYLQSCRGWGWMRRSRDPQCGDLMRVHSRVLFSS